MQKYDGTENIDFSMFHYDISQTKTLNCATLKNQLSLEQY